MIALKKKAVKVIYDAYVFMGEKADFDTFLQKIVNNRKSRLNFLLKMRTARALLVDRGNYDLVRKVDNLKMAIADLFDEMVPVEQAETEGPVQSYLNPCTVRLRNRRLANLSYYDNRRSGYPTDRYYFGIYGGFLE